MATTSVLKQIAGNVLDVMPERMVTALMAKGPRYYDERYKRAGGAYDCDLRESPYFHLYREAAAMVGNHPILELGCGTGMFAAYYATNYLAYIMGLDFSATAIQKAIARWNSVTVEQDGFRRFYQHDITRYYPYKWHERFNWTVVLLEVLEHIPDDLGMLALIPDQTRIVLSVPNFWSRDHVRRFKSKQQVIDRYASRITVQDSAIIDEKFFLLQGVTR